MSEWPDDARAEALRLFGSHIELYPSSTMVDQAALCLVEQIGREAVEAALTEAGVGYDEPRRCSSFGSPDLVPSQAARRGRPLRGQGLQQTTCRWRAECLGVAQEWEAMSCAGCADADLYSPEELQDEWDGLGDILRAIASGGEDGEGARNVPERTVAPNEAENLAKRLSRARADRPGPMDAWLEGVPGDVREEMERRWRYEGRLLEAAYERPDAIGRLFPTIRDLLAEP